MTVLQVSDDWVRHVRSVLGRLIEHGGCPMTAPQTGAHLCAAGMCAWTRAAADALALIKQADARVG